MAKKKKKSGIDVGARLRNIKTLVSTKRSKEAIAYEYMLFTMLCTAKYREKKLPSQSIRDYAMKMVQDHGLDPANVYPFIQKVEEVIYGGRPASPDAYQNSLELFGKVFLEIVGKPLPPI
jgi:hypothetical protein